ncbi:MAG: hypothetical protein GY862_24100 [Gammaproteobacteria bacterium]|nr:hypothetical protein [Gammaproteobacteria bacterium]
MLKANKLSFVVCICALFCQINLPAKEPQAPPVFKGKEFDNVEAILANMMPRSPFLAIAFSPDGKFLAAASDDSVYLWDVQSGAYSRLKGNNVIVAVAFSPDGKLLAAGSDHAVYLWDMKTNREIKRLQGHSKSVRAVAFSPDGKLLASGAGDADIRLWEVRSGREIKRLQGHSDGVNSLAFSPDGKLLASGSSDAEIRLWDAASGSTIKRLAGDSELINSVAFSPDGKILASGAKDGIIRLWEMPAGREIRRLKKHSLDVNSVAFSPDGKFLISGSWDKSIRLWDVQSGREIKRLDKHSDNVAAVAFSPDKETFASASWDYTVRLWGVSSNKQLPILKGFSSPVNAVSVSPDGKLLASVSEYGGVDLWSMSSGRQINQLAEDSDNIKSIAFSIDSKLLAIGSGELVSLWEVSPPRKYRRLEEHFGEVTAVAFSSDGQTLASGSRDNSIRLWNIQSGEKIHRLTGHSDHVYAIAFSPDGLTLVSGSDDRSVRLWDVQSGKETKRLEGHSYFISAVAFSPDGKMLASGSWDKTIRLWDLSKNQEIIHLKGPAYISAIAFSPDGSILASGSWDNSVRLWDVQSGREIDQLKNHSDYITAVTFSPDGKTLVSGSKDASLRLWDVKTGKLRRGLMGGARGTWLNCDFFADKCSYVKGGTSFPITPSVSFEIWIVVILLCFLTGSVYYLLVYRHPLVQTLSADHGQLLNLPLEQLPKARWLLRWTHRLGTVLSGADSHSKWLGKAIAFTAKSNYERYHWLAKRLGAVEQRTEDTDLFILHLSESFPVNLDRCLVYFPAPGLHRAEIAMRLGRDEMSAQVIVIVSLNPEQQAALRAYAENPANLWVVPNNRELSALLLSPEPAQIFVRLLAAQLAVTRLSPYQTGGGVTRDAAFFGRHEILAWIINREPANYLLIGGRQLGKTSLLKQIERSYRDHPGVDCELLILSEGDSARRINAAIDHLLSTGKRGLLLIDEADRFIRREIAGNYPMLSRLRGLSEEGRCHFILAGFWDLYESVVRDYHSPIKNFGESIIVGALEAQACRQLATKPMALMNIGYASGDLVEQILSLSGQRANLIAIVCNEMLENAARDQRILREEDVIRALQSRAVRDALEGWRALSDDENAARLDVIIVEATVEKEKFDLSAVKEILKEHEYTEAQWMQSLARLELAFIIRREKEQYAWCVPLFRKLFKEGISAG